MSIDGEDLTSLGKLFHNFGAHTENALSPKVVVFDLGTLRRYWLLERKVKYVLVNSLPQRVRLSVQAWLLHFMNKISLIKQYNFSLVRSPIFLTRWSLFGFNEEAYASTTTPPTRTSTNNIISRYCNRASFNRVS